MAKVVLIFHFMLSHYSPFRHVFRYQTQSVKWNRYYLPPQVVASRRGAENTAVTEKQYIISSYHNAYLWLSAEGK